MSSGTTTGTTGTTQKKTSLYGFTDRIIDGLTFEMNSLEFKFKTLGSIL
jgi:hypothetical protein